MICYSYGTISSDVETYKRGNLVMQQKRFLKNLVPMIMVGIVTTHGFRTLTAPGLVVGIARAMAPKLACSALAAIGELLTRVLGPVSLSLPKSLNNYLIKCACHTFFNPFLTIKAKLIVR